MDWKQLKENAVKHAETLKKEALHLADQASYLSANGITKTPLTVKTAEEFSQIQDTARLVLVVGNETSETYRNLVLKLPVLASKAWVSSAQLRFVDTTKTPELKKILGVTGNPTVLAYRSGELKKTLTEKSEIDAFFKDIVL